MNSNPLSPHSFQYKINGWIWAGWWCHHKINLWLDVLLQQCLKDLLRLFNDTGPSRRDSRVLVLWKHWFCCAYEGKRRFLINQQLCPKCFRLKTCIRPTLTRSHKVQSIQHWFLHNERRRTIREWCCSIPREINGRNHQSFNVIWTTMSGHKTTWLSVKALEL